MAFWDQVCPQADELKARFAADFVAAPSLKKYFEINYGPYNRLAGNDPFLDVDIKCPGAGFYTDGISKHDLNNYLEEYPEEKAKLLSPYTVVERDGGRYRTVPYHEFYSRYLNDASQSLLVAASNENRPHFKRYLESRARDLLTDDFNQSDSLWIDLPPDGLDIVIGPYEVYEDQLLGVKAAYEAMITYQDAAETHKVQGFVSQIERFQSFLTAKLGLVIELPGPASPLIVADLLYSAGDARKAIPAIAFTLPNDEEVIREKGTKEVILRNLLNEKFRNVVVPIGEFLSGSLRFTLDADSEIEGFVTHTILHEISHSLGPHQIIVAAERTTVNKALREHHATFEEAKADVLAACWFLWSGGSDGGSINAGSAAYYLPGVVRSLRFGITVAHGLANLLQFNYSSRQGAIRVSSDGLPRIDRHHLQSGLLALAKDILEIQQAGDYLAAKAFAKTYCKHTPVTRTLLGKLEHIPIDILPSFFNKNCRRAG